MAKDIYDLLINITFHDLEENLAQTFFFKNESCKTLFFYSQEKCYTDLLRKEST